MDPGTGTKVLGTIVPIRYSSPKTMPTLPVSRGHDASLGCYGGTEGNLVSQIQQTAPSGDEVTDYDRRHLWLYAALLDAADAGGDWQDAAAALMEIDASDTGAETCWRSHLERARWIVGDGLASALSAFGG
jgi:hypothetical protein